MELESKKEYELAVLVDDETAESEIDGLLVAKLDDSNLQKEPAKLLSLSYPIKKHNSATMLVYRFYALPGTVAKMQENLHFHGSVLRALLVTPPMRKASTNQRADKKAASLPVQNTSSKSATLHRGFGSEISSNELLAQALEKLENNK